jgi:hypothetical protein
VRIAAPGQLAGRHQIAARAQVPASAITS